MEEAMAENYWCYQCSQVVTPIVEIEIKCPVCRGGFIEQMNGGTRDGEDIDSSMGSDRALSLWAPILLGMIGNPRRRRRFDRIEFEEDTNGNGNGNGEAHNDGNADVDREHEFIIRRRRNSAAILQLLQGIRDGMASEVENSENDRADTGWLKLKLQPYKGFRYQMPADESKLDSERPRANNTNPIESGNNVRDIGEGSERDGRSRNGRRFTIPWPFNGLFSSGSQSNGADSSSTSSSSQSGTASQRDET
ncbi:BCA2 zinc finger ATL 4 [Hibiscus trionum]|uniref:RING-type E3 ubiquitin transferase n=1 Tax=Hibiscus trionum TaxID=183268 RepID=A0A9W7M1H5_HIBTR|nr:BCA2 zinc finger ATL 4 [Hibiscus trionum]